MRARGRDPVGCQFSCDQRSRSESCGDVIQGMTADQIDPRGSRLQLAERPLRQSCALEQSAAPHQQSELI